MTTPTPVNPNQPPPRTWRNGPVTLDELSAGLVWPTLLRTPVLALQPPRVLIGILVMLALWGIGRLLDWLLAFGGVEAIGSPLVWRLRDGWLDASEQLVSLHPAEALRFLGDATFGHVLGLLEYRPLTAGLAVLLLAPIFAIGSGAIARSVAVDLAVGTNLGVRDSLAFALRRWASFLGALIIPVVLIGVGIGALKVAGWLFLGLPYLNVLGALAYGLFLLVGLFTYALLIGFMLGQPMLAPAVAVEGTDAVDAIQRVYAYLLGRPGRALIYLFLAIAQGLIAIGLAAWVLNGAADLTSSMAGSFLSGEKSRALFEPGHQAGAAGAIVAFWQLCVALVLSGILVSWHATAGTLIYLLLRRVCDEQDLREVWMPGVIPGTRAAETPTPARSGAMP
ncbi:MAG: hypothetical protein JNK58_12340 [Phycisphaerae bacterium]|nr:hypothetical protein [Phycisphaerae bacterium]